MNRVQLSCTRTANLTTDPETGSKQLSGCEIQLLRIKDLGLINQTFPAPAEFNKYKKKKKINRNTHPPSTHPSPPPPHTHTPPPSDPPNPIHSTGITLRGFFPPKHFSPASIASLSNHACIHTSFCSFLSVFSRRLSRELSSNVPNTTGVACPSRLNAGSRHSIVGAARHNGTVMIRPWR